MLHLAPLIQDLAIILAAAALVAFFFERIRQPVVLGYIIAGALIGPHVFSKSLVTDLPNVKTWAELGVIFLMFSLGLEFSFRKLSKIGITAGITAAIEIPMMIALGIALGSFFDWNAKDSLFLGCMLAISSTTIIFKALDGLGLRMKRFSEMIFAILIVEDLVAILILATLSSFAIPGQLEGMDVLISAGKLILIVGGWFLAGYFILPRFVRQVGRTGNEEMLTVLSVGLCLALVTFSAYFQYSVALGAFIMGSILSETSESKKIEELIRPLRDVFVAIFFVSVGMLIQPNLIIENINSIFIISAAVILGKITFITFGNLSTGQTLKTSIQVGFGMAQIGEFSFIIATLGYSLNVISDFLYPIIVSVSLITTFTTPYFIKISHKLAVKTESKLPNGIRQLLIKYSSWIQEKSKDLTRRKRIYKCILTWFCCGIVVTLCFIVISKSAMPFFGWPPFIGWSAAIFFTAPFIWAMLNIFKNLIRKKSKESQFTPEKAVVLISRLTTIALIGTLSGSFFPFWIALLLTALIIMFLVIVFYKQLETSFKWYEKQFLVNFKEQKKSTRKKDPLKHLAPWDARLIRIKVHPNSTYVGKTLTETNLKKEHGLNVVVIQRGQHSLIAPNANEKVYPADELLFLGTDDQIEIVREILENPDKENKSTILNNKYELGKFLVKEISPVNDKTIQDCGIKKRFECLVVGIERNQKRFINPQSSFKIKKDDFLWIVGESSLLKKLRNYLHD